MGTSEQSDDPAGGSFRTAEPFTSALQLSGEAIAAAMAGMAYAMLAMFAVALMGEGMSAANEPTRQWEFKLHAHGQVTSETGEVRTLCTETQGTLRGDGTWLLRINMADLGGPLIELAGDGSTSVATIRETITAALNPETEARTNQTG